MADGCVGGGGGAWPKIKRSCEYGDDVNSSLLPRHQLTGTRLEVERAAQSTQSKQASSDLPAITHYSVQHCAGEQFLPVIDEGPLCARSTAFANSSPLSQPFILC